MKQKRGFTLIELIVVISIIAIIVGWSVGLYKGYTKEANLSKHMTYVKELESAAERYYMKEGNWPRIGESYASEQVEEFSQKIKDITMKEIELDPAGKYYDINYNELSKYIKTPKEKGNYIIQNPVGRVYYLENITELRKNIRDYTPVVIDTNIISNKITQLINDGFIIPQDVLDEAYTVINNDKVTYKEVQDILEKLETSATKKEYSYKDTSAVDKLTGNTSSVDVIIRESSAWAPSFAGYRAFDGITNVADNVWESEKGNLPGAAWLEIEFKDNKNIGKYNMYPSFWGGKLWFNPTDWDLQAWDGSKWVIIDTQVGVTTWQAGIGKTFIIDNPNYYNKYRISVNKVMNHYGYSGSTETNSYVAIAELQLMEAY